MSSLQAPVLAVAGDAPSAREHQPRFGLGVVEDRLGRYRRVAMDSPRDEHDEHSVAALDSPPDDLAVIGGAGQDVDLPSNSASLSTLPSRQTATTSCPRSSACWTMYFPRFPGRTDDGDPHGTLVTATARARAGYSVAPPGRTRSLVGGRPSCAALPARVLLACYRGLARRADAWEMSFAHVDSLSERGQPIAVSDRSIVGRLLLTHRPVSAASKNAVMRSSYSVATSRMAAVWPTSGRYQTSTGLSPAARS